jgi:hypothetical protein
MTHLDPYAPLLSALLIFTLYQYYDEELGYDGAYFLKGRSLFAGPPLGTIQGEEEAYLKRRGWAPNEEENCWEFTL